MLVRVIWAGVVAAVVAAMVYGQVAAMGLAADYCDLCDGNQTVCVREGCPLEAPCENTTQVALEAADVALVLDVHNRLRSRVAVGSVAGQPNATNMNELLWDEELAAIAQCWANNCRFAHDACRDTHKYHVNQNAGLFGSTLFAETLDPQVLNNTITSWFDEVANFSAADIPQREFKFTNTLHYSQLVWAETKYVGCARVFYEDEGFLTTLLFCNYAPAGNYANLPVYLEGDPCTQCEEGRVCSEVYEGLCAENNAIT